MTVGVVGVADAPVHGPPLHALTDWQATLVVGVTGGDQIGAVLCRDRSQRNSTPL
jgi:hypothetical protein